MASRLSFDERARIEAMQQAGVRVVDTARRLGRDPSTIHRELKRNGSEGGYDAAAAQGRADRRAARPKEARLGADPELAAMVSERPAMRWSPHAVCADLRAEGRRISAETIYAACYDPTGSRGLPEGSRRLLPRRCRRRKPRAGRTRKPSPLGDLKSIAARPAAAEDRREARHWEGDVIIGAANRSAVATLTERTSRLTLAVALPGGYDARRAGPPAEAPRQDLTWDQRREMARWADVEAALGIDVYFCDPHSPWQRPINEHTNGLLRRRLPKAPTSTSAPPASPSSRTTSTPCPANSTTGTHPTAFMLH